MKKFAAILLTVAMLLSICSTASFAFSSGDKITFVHSNSSESERYYVGEVYEGENAFAYNGGPTKAFFKFVAEESGYYSATLYYACFAQKTSDTKATQIDSEAFYYNEGMCYIYLEEGTYYIADSFASSTPEPEDINITIDYLGEFVEVTYDESAFDFAVAGADVDMYNKELYGAEPKIVFENGSLDDFRGIIGFDCDGEVETGENTVSFEIAGTEFEEVLTVYDVTDIVESIEVNDLDTVTTNLKTYQGVYSFYPVEITVNYADGTTENVRLEKSESGGYTFPIEFPNGKIYYAYAEHTYADMFEMYLCDYKYISESVTSETASVAETTEMLLDAIYNIMSSDADVILKILSVAGEILSYILFIPVALFGLAG